MTIKHLVYWLKRLNQLLLQGMIQLIRAYQQQISARRPACCKYLPTCSDYAIQALQRYGLLRGGLKAMWRILRCNPFSRGGYDPLR